jgi:hypothetical protein
MTSKTKLIERNPVILSLLILKEMGITEEQHPKFVGEWAPLWRALIAYRDSVPAAQWDAKLFANIVEGRGPRTLDWEALDHQLNVIYTKATS